MYGRRSNSGRLARLPACALVGGHRVVVVPTVVGARSPSAGMHGAVRVSLLPDAHAETEACLIMHACMRSTMHGPMACCPHKLLFFASDKTMASDETAAAGNV